MKNKKKGVGYENAVKKCALKYCKGLYLVGKILGNQIHCIFLLSKLSIWWWPGIKPTKLLWDLSIPIIDMYWDSIR